MPLAVGGTLNTNTTKNNNWSIFVYFLKSIEMGRGEGRLHAIVSQMAGRSMWKNVQDNICRINSRIKSAAGMHHTLPWNNFITKTTHTSSAIFTVKLNTVVSTRILYSKFHRIFKSRAVTPYCWTKLNKLNHNIPKSLYRLQFKVWRKFMK